MATRRRNGSPDYASQDETWRALMRQAQDGDQVAYTQLLSGLTPVLRRLVRRHWLNAEEVEDLVQDVLLSLHTVRHTYDPDRPFLPWFLTITRRRVADAARVAARRNAHETIYATPPETATEDGDRVDAMALREALGTLAPGQRQAVELLKLRGLSLEEAAVASGKSVVSLKVAMHRARHALRRVFAGDV